MTEVSVTPCGEAGCYKVTGRLIFATVPAVRHDTVRLFKDASDSINLDLAGVTHADSAGMALLIEWMRLAHGQGKSIFFKNIPLQMQAIAKVGGLEGLLPLA